MTLPLRLRHLRAVVVDHPLGEEAQERLAEAEQTQVVERLHEEARIEQVQDGVLDAADVLVDREPVVGDLPAPRSLLVARVAVADEVPGGVDERVHRVRLAMRLSPAARAGRVHPVLGGRERRAALRQILLDLGEEHGQVLLGHRDHPAGLAVEDGDRAAPVTLAGEEPVAQAVADLGPAETLRLQPLDDRLLPLIGRQTRELRGVDEALLLGVRDVSPVLPLSALGRDDDLHRQVVAARELEVALVVRGHGHDRPGPVLHEDVVGDPDRKPLTVHGIRHERAREDAGLLLLGICALGRGAGARPADVLQDLGLVRRPGDEPGHQRMLRREHEERRTEERVGAGGEDGDVDVQLLDPEDDFGALRASDPVPLHRQHVLGPGLQQAHLVEQPVGVGGDAEEPLLEAPALDLGPAALAAPVDHLLVRQHRLVVGAPVDRRLLPVGEALLEELEEEPLGPAVVGRVLRATTSRSQSIAQPMRRICSRMAAMFRSVTTRGWPPSRMAAFSAGRPKAS